MSAIGKGFILKSRWESLRSLIKDYRGGAEQPLQTATALFGLGGDSPLRPQTINSSEVFGGCCYYGSAFSDSCYRTWG